VLDRFYRIPGTRGEGAGLGLAIVEEIARRHRASVLIEDGDGGRGTRIRLLFPWEDGPGGTRFARTGKSRR
jgi:two-component system sensor histidine kinase TctE